MSDEPSLPHLPGVSWDERSQSFSNNPRKRVRHQSSRNAPSSNCNSSDPAVFSSDDDPALDNYVEGRRKKRYVGSWFQQQPTSSDSTFSEALQVPKARRQWTRQADSGVFLGSDGNESDDILDHVEVLPRARLPQLDRPAVSQVSRAEYAARDKIRSCVDQGEETVDLWSMGLERISNDTISPLSQLECIPVVAKDVAFEHKDPELKIYLAMNRLIRVPGALFDLTHLTTLSLRGNKLTELPPAISKLRNLRELNVSQNRLRHVPTELLDLFEAGTALHTLALHPNPFLLPDDAEVAEGHSPDTLIYRWEEGQTVSVMPRLVSRSLGRSPSQLRNSSGRILSNFRIPRDLSISTIPLQKPNEVPPAQSNPNASPSLLEVALRTCYGSAQLPEMSEYIPDGLAHLRELLDRALQQKESGGLVCSQCRKLVVVPIAEWVEWRDLRTCERVDGETARVVPLSRAKNERAVPFLYRACSMRCAQLGAGRLDEDAWGVPKGYEALSTVSGLEPPGSQE